MRIRKMRIRLPLCSETRPRPAGVREKSCFRLPAISREDQTQEELMSKSRQILTYAAGLLIPAGILLAIWPKLAAYLFARGGGDQSVLPHRMRYLWVAQVYWMNLTSDVLIGVSHLAISSTLI